LLVALQLVLAACDDEQEKLDQSQDQPSETGEFEEIEELEELSEVEEVAPDELDIPLQSCGTVMDCPDVDTQMCANGFCIDPATYVCASDGDCAPKFCVEARCVYCRTTDDCPTAPYQIDCVNGQCVGEPWDPDPIEEVEFEEM
jgi:hypothetical protein